MKIPFDIKYRPQIESGEYKVVTRDNAPVRIVCWDAANAKQPIVGLTYDSDEKREIVRLFCNNGSYWKPDKMSPLDLFIITPEPELTEFEQEVCTVSNLCLNLEMKDEIHSAAKQLLAIAKKELCKDCILKEMDENRVYKYEGPRIPVYWPPCYFGGACTNPFHDCINCHRQSTVGINTASGTSIAKEDEK